MNDFNKLEEYLAIVTGIHEGKHGPYMSLTCEDIPGWISASLLAPVWTEASLPGKGTRVVISDFSKKKQWRANSARYLRPSDKIRVIGSDNINSEKQETAVEQQ